LRVDYRKVPKVFSGGESYASGLERDLGLYLHGLVRLGELSDLKRQVNVHLTAARILMIPDFSAVDVKTGETIYFEAKGFPTDVWRLKRRLWKAGYGPGMLRVFKRSGKTIRLDEEIIPRKGDIE